MCGIAAVLLYPQERDPQAWRAIRTMFTRNLIFNQERGQAATGIAIVQADGRFDILKQPIQADEFTALPQYRHMMTRIGAHTTLILGHTRLPTKGDPQHPENNHPIVADHVLGVHNGHVHNDDELFQRYAYPRHAGVDSEIIFRMIAALSPLNTNGSYLHAVRQRLRLLRGQFTFLAVDLHKPQQLILLKHRNPLCLHFHSEWNALFFSSRYIFLRKTFGRVILTETLPHDRVLLFDALRLPTLGSQPAEGCPL